MSDSIKTLRRCPNCFTVLRPEEEECWVCLEGPDMVVYVDGEIPKADLAEAPPQQHRNAAHADSSGSSWRVFRALLTGVMISLGSVVIGVMIGVIAVVSFIVSLFESVTEGCAPSALMILGILLVTITKCIQFIVALIGG